MSNEIDKETAIDVTEPSPPIEVKVINKNEKKWNDSTEHEEYDEHQITDKEIEEHQNGNT